MHRFWDTQGGDFPEEVEEESPVKGKISTSLGESKSNEMEVALCRFHVANLVKAGLNPAEIAVITPYSAQVSFAIAQRRKCA